MTGASGGGMGGSGAVDTLFIDVTARLDGFEQRMAQVEQTAEQTGERAGSRLGNALSVGMKAAAGAALVLGAGIGTFIADGFAGVSSGQQAVSQLETTIKSMGNVAGVSSEGLQAFASKIQLTTQFATESVNGVQSMLLTFGNIKAEGGIFDRATQSALDMSQALGSDASGAAIQLGKALNDPVKGVSALAKVGVSFSSDQKEVIKSLVKTGDVAGAQTIILKELERQFGGSAAAAGQTFAGQMARAQNALGEVAESIAVRAMPLVQNLADRFIANMPQIQAVTDKAVGSVIKGFDFLSANVFPALIGAFNAVRPVVVEAARVLGDLGTRVVPVVVSAIDTGRPVVLALADGFQKLSAWVQRNKEILIPLAAGIGTIAGALAIHRLAVIASIAITNAWTVAQAAATTASIALRAGIAFLTGPVGLAALAITGLIAAGVYLYRNWDEVKAKALAIWGSLKQIVAGAINSVVTFLRGIDLKEIGLDIVRGLANGILAGPRLVLNAARGLGSAVLSGIKGVLNIQSPSKETYLLGEHAGTGFAGGITKTAPLVQKAAAGVGGVVLSELEKARQALEKDIKMDAWVEGLGRATTAQLKLAQTEARSQGDRERYTAITSELARRQTAATAATDRATEAAKREREELSNNRAQIARGEAWANYVEGLRSATSAQLASALATARAAGEVETYNAIKAEQARRTDVATAASDRAADAAQREADAIRQGREAIADSREYETWKAAMGRATDAQLASGLAAYEAAGNQQRYNDVLAEITRRAGEAAQEVNTLVDAQIRAVDARFLDTGAATASAYQQSYGTGDEGLIRSLAATTGLTIAQVRADVEGALADAKRFASDAAAIIERVYADALTHRRTVAAEEQRLSDQLVSEGVAAANARRAAIVEELQAEQAAAADASVTFEGLNAILGELSAQGRDPAQTGFITWLEELAKGSGQAADAAQRLLDKLERQAQVQQQINDGPLLSASPARGTGQPGGFANGPMSETPDPARGVRGTPEESVAVPPRVPPEVQKSWDDFVATLRKGEWAKATADELKGLTDAQLAEAKGLALASQNRERYLAVLTEEERRAKEAADTAKEAASNQNTLTAARQKLTETLQGGAAPYAAEIASLEAMRGKTGVVTEELDALIAKYQELQDKALRQKALEEKINTWADYARRLIPVVTGAMEALGGATSEVAGQWAADLGSMVNDLVSFGTAIARGDYVGAAIQALTSIFNWWNRNKKAAQEAAQATREYNEQFQFSQNGYGTRTTGSYTTGFLFWSTTHYTEQIDTLKRDIALALEGGFINGIQDGFQQALAQNDFSLFEKSLKTSVGKAVLAGLIESFINQAVLARVIGPAIDAYLQNGDAAALQAAIRAASGEAQAFYDQVLAPIAQEFGLLGTGTSAPQDGSSTGTSPQLNQTVRVEAPSIASSINFDVLSTLASNVLTLAQAVPLFVESGRAHLESGSRHLAAADRLERALTRFETVPIGRWNAP